MFQGNALDLGSDYEKWSKDLYKQFCKVNVTILGLLSTDRDGQLKA